MTPTTFGPRWHGFASWPWLVELRLALVRRAIALIERANLAEAAPAEEAGVRHLLSPLAWKGPPAIHTQKVPKGQPLAT